MCDKYIRMSGGIGVLFSSFSSSVRMTFNVSYFSSRSGSFPPFLFLVPFKLHLYFQQLALKRDLVPRRGQAGLDVSKPKKKKLSIRVPVQLLLLLLLKS